MEPGTLIDIISNAGPIGVLAWILWHQFSRQAASAEKFADGVLAEMKADREILRQEFAGHRDALTALQSEISGMRADIAGGDKCPVLPLQRMGDRQ